MTNCNHPLASSPGRTRPEGAVQSQASIPVVRIEPSRGWGSLELRNLWEYRELFYFLVWREVKVRYKQTVIGAAWAMIQPLMTMIIFTVVFSHFVRVPSDGIPYPIFAYTGLLPWTYFSSAINRTGNSLLADANLIRKVYFPRLILPLSAVTAPAVDFLFSLAVLAGMMMWFRIAPTWGVLALPFLLLLALLTALAVGLWLSPLNAQYRDVTHIIPFLVQVWMYACPVIYPVSLVPEKWRVLYSLNPMVGVIEGFRWALLGKENSAIGLTAMAVSALVVVMLLCGGVNFFKRMERSFADIV